VEAAQAGKLKALYVVGANPLAHYGAENAGRGKLDLLIVHEMFLTETAKAADIVFLRLRHTKKTARSQTLPAKYRCCTKARK